MDTTSPAPQANRIETVVAVVDAIAAGCDTAASIGAGIGLSARQGAYYAQAAKTLGYADVDTTLTPAEWSLTDVGATLLDMGAEALAAAITDTLLSLPELEVLTASDGAETLTESLSTEGYAQTTCARRQLTWAAWMDFATSPEAARVTALGRVKRDAATHAPAAAAARAEQKRATAKPGQAVGQNCPTCFTAKSLTGVCDTCD